RLLFSSSSSHCFLHSFPTRRSSDLLFVLFVSFPLSLHAQSKHTLSTPYPSKEAVALYAYINDMFGKRMLSGQMESSWGIEEMEYIEKVTGKLPAIRGMDFINNKDNNNEVDRKSVV